MKNISGKLILIMTIVYFLIISYFLIGGILSNASSNYLGPFFAYFIFTLPTSFLISVLSGDSGNIFLLIITGIINTLLFYFILKLLQIILMKIAVIIRTSFR